MRRLRRLGPLVLLLVGAGLIIYQIEEAIIGRPMSGTELLTGAALLLVGAVLKTYTDPKA